METIKVICKENKRLGWKIINKADQKPGDKLYTAPKKRVVKKRLITVNK